MTKMLLSLFLFVLMFHSCGPKEVSYEDATKWHSDCLPYPIYHPGDVYATGAVLMYPYQEVEHVGIDERSCIEQCNSKYIRNCGDSNEGSMQKHFKGVGTCGSRFNRCKFKCIEKGHPTGEIAEHISGGFYSDKSYFAMCNNPFENIHPTKDKYEKTKWQKDRDECMQITSENFQIDTYWDRTNRGLQELISDSSAYYKECLNERGYSIVVY